MSNRLFFSHGDKGGVGKSVLSALLVDQLLSSGKDVGIVEGDTQADIAIRFADLVDVSAANLNRSGAAEEAILAFSEALENLAGKDVVVNLPSGAGDTLEAFAEPLVSVADALGLDVFVFYSLGHQSSATKNALRSVESGLLGAVPMENRCIAYPGFLGSPDSFDWVKSGAREKAGNMQEVVIPAIKPEALAMKVLSLSGPFSAMTKKDFSGLTLMEKALLQSKWIKPSLAAVSLFDRGQ
ncbi:MAG: hypothetical protein U7M05_11725 [Candidatus Igneacidithiobacillus chanchocoensis]